MSFLAPILLHSDDVPAEAKRALMAADAAPAGQRDVLLKNAARVLFHTTGIDCGDALELVGLPQGG